MSPPKSPYQLHYGQDPLPLSKIPEIFKPAVVANIVAIEEIRQRLAYYLFCVDGNAFEHFDQVFTKDAIGNYSAPLGNLVGLEQLQQVLRASTERAQLQHLASTQ